ncbi:putative transcriptional regulatory protein C1F7.11c [Mycena kentingensis (nom. inval.)]|nr:putative transcriptional regulatory protein C1F7.11c [Mycena kentingensis (nom. inval.)]
MAPILNPAFNTLTEDDKLEFKRLSGKVSCAECKRLKLKCNRETPCSSCVRRGCGGTCPTGSFAPTGRGKRAVPTESSRLKETLSVMEERARILEEAVTQACNYHLTICPYLATGEPDAGEHDLVDEATRGIGALTITQEGSSQYFGPTAASEALLSVESEANSPPESTTPTNIDLLGLIPFTSEDNSLSYLLAALPTVSRATHLADLYFSNCCWSGTPILSEELNELLLLVYEPSASPVNFYHLAVLYGIFGVASLVDLDLPVESSDAGYYSSSAAPRSTQHTCKIQALVTLSMLYWQGGAKASVDAAWTAMSMALDICVQTGLIAGQMHGSWTPLQIQRQRYLFWGTYSIAIYFGFVVGRPISVFLEHIRCPFPDQLEPSAPPTFDRRRWEFVKQVGAPVLETFLKVAKHAPSYEDVLDFDGRIRQFMESAWCTAQVTNDSTTSAAAYIQSKHLKLACYSVLLCIHSPWFLRAVRQNPISPWESHYATSFLAGFRVASELIRDNIESFARFSELLRRWWPILVGTLAVKCPESEYGPQALLELFVAVDVFERHGIASGRGRNGLTILRMLRDKASAAYFPALDSLPVPVDVPDSGDKEIDAALGVFSGKTRVVAASLLKLNSRESKAVDPIVADYLAAAADFGPSATWEDVPVVDDSQGQSIPDMEDAPMFDSGMDWESGRMRKVKSASRSCEHGFRTRLITVLVIQDTSHLLIYRDSKADSGCPQQARPAPVCSNDADIVNKRQRPGSPLNPLAVKIRTISMRMRVPPSPAMEAPRPCAAAAAVAGPFRLDIGMRSPVHVPARIPTPKFDSDPPPLRRIYPPVPGWEETWDSVGARAQLVLMDRHSAELKERAERKVEALVLDMKRRREMDSTGRVWT